LVEKMKSPRVDYFKKNFAGNVLDLGCNYGLLHGLLDDGEIIGLDIENTNYKERVIRGNVLDMPVKSASFGTVIAGELFEHMPDPEKFLGECARVLKNGGVLLLSTPNRGAWSNRLSHRFDNASAGSEYPHQSVVDEAQLRALCGKFFKIREFIYMPYDKVSSPNRYTQRGLKIANAYYWLRKAVHFVVPEKMREQMIVKCEKA